RLLAGQLGGRQFPQFFVDQRPESLGRLGVALLDGAEDAGDVVHGWHQSGVKEPPLVRGGTATAHPRQPPPLLYPGRPRADSPPAGWQEAGTGPSWSAPFRTSTIRRGEGGRRSPPRPPDDRRDSPFIRTGTAKGPAMTAPRVEHDSLGPVSVPA